MIMDIARINRRWVLRGTAAAAGLAVAGCGPGSRDTDSGPAAIEVPGQLGTVRLDGVPRNVVAVGQYRDADAAVALGVVPVAMPDLSTFLTGGVAPWVRPRLGSATPALFDSQQLPLERMSGWHPDLILATDRSRLPEVYGLLSKIAPTLSYANGYNKDPWQLTSRRIGTALGRERAARALVQQVEDRIATARRTNPGFAGKTFTLGPVTADGTVNTISRTTDASATFMSQLGLRLSPKVTSLPQSSIPGRAIISPERLDLLDADVLMLTFNTPAARERLESQPLFQAIPAVRNGTYIALDLPIAIAIGFPSALSIPYALDRVVPLIQAALKRGT